MNWGKISIKLKNTISSLLVAAFLTGVIIFVLPKGYFNAHRIDKIAEERIVPGIKTYYNDLNNNGTPETIQYYTMDNSVHSINISEENTFLDLFYLANEEFSISKNLAFADNNKNEIKEIYFVSFQNKVFYLNSIEFDKKTSFKTNRVPLDSVNELALAQSASNHFFRFTEDNKVIFDLQLGSDSQSQKLYLYDLKKKRLERTACSRSVCNNLKVTKYNNKNLFLPVYLYASGSSVFLKQVQTDTLKQSSSYKNNGHIYENPASFLALYNDSLKNEFPPFAYTAWTNNTSADFFMQNKKLNIALLTWSLNDSLFVTTLNIIDSNGKRTKSRTIEGGNYYLVTNMQTNEIMIFDGKSNEIKIIDEQLKLRKRIADTKIKHIYGFKDLNNDNSPEFIVVEEGKLVVYQNNMKEKTVLPINICSNTFSTEAIFETFSKNGETLLNIEISNSAYIIKYTNNHKLYLKYPLFLLIFFLAYFVIWFLIKINSRRLEIENRKLEKTVFDRTKEISEKNEILYQQKEELTLITEELKAINEHMLELNDFKEVMVGTIVHDLKNSLNSILNLSDDINILQPAHSMLNLVMNILEVQKYESETMKLVPEDSMLDDIIDKAIEKVELLLAARNLTIVRKYNKAIQLFVDVHIIVRIFENLFTNAIKFSPLNEIIEVNAAMSTENRVNIAVKDNGPGIPENMLPVIFNKFIQQESIDSGKVNSTGLGLTFCKMAVEAHNGKLTAKNDKVKGAVFGFSLPGRETQKKTKYKHMQPLEKQSFLSEKAISILKPVVGQLDGIAIYKVSYILSVLEKISNNEDPEVQKWKTQLEQAVFSGNNELYRKLLKLENGLK